METTVTAEMDLQVVHDENDRLVEVQVMDGEARVLTITPSETLYRGVDDDEIYLITLAAQCYITAKSVL